MSEPNPPEQDTVGRGPRVRLRLVLALLRLLGGRRGHASVTWSGQGFVYTLEATRGAPVPLSVDRDPTALNGAEADLDLRDRLQE
jgi:hypothetical protein